MVATSVSLPCLISSFSFQTRYTTLPALEKYQVILNRR